MRTDDAFGCLVIVAIYGFLSALCFFGALAWNSYFMWGMGVLWMIVGVLVVCWALVNRLPDEEL